MRPPVDRLRIHYFLVKLGIEFRHPVRLYLVGGTTLVYEGLRHQSLDIDIHYEIADDHVLAGATYPVLEVKEGRLQSVEVPALNALNDRILAGCTEVIEKHNLPGYAVGIGSKGCVTFSTNRIVDYLTFKEGQDADLADLAWLFNMNRGIYMTPGREEEWTLSVTHTDESVDRYVEVFEEMAHDLTA